MFSFTDRSYRGHEIRAISTGAHSQKNIESENFPGNLFEVVLGLILENILSRKLP